MTWFSTRWPAVPTGIGLGALLAVLITLTAASPMGAAVHGDGHYTYLWARSLVFDGDFDMANDYRECGDPWNLADSPLGRNINYWNLGPIIFWVPSLLWDRAFSSATDHGDARARIACNGPMAERAVRGSVVAGFLAALLGFLIARRRFSDGSALFGACAIALLGPLTYYSTTMLSYGHAASSFGAAAAFYAWDRFHREQSWRAWAIQGAALGLAMLMRSQNAILVVLPFVTWCTVAVGLPRRTWQPWMRHVALGSLFTAAMLLVFLPQMLVWHSMTGDWLGVPQGEHYMRWSEPRIANTLFAASNGAFVWSPILYVAALGWACMCLRRTQRRLALALLVIAALDIYVVASVYDWWGSIGFPGRRLDMLAAPAMVAVAAFGHEIGVLNRRRPAVGPAVAALLLLSFGLFWHWGIQAGLARGMRTDLARPSDVVWGEAFNHARRRAWKRIGNPLTYPASLPFALRYGVHPRSWDVVGSQELFYHDHQTMQRRERESTLSFADANARGYFDGTFRDTESVFEGTRIRIADRGSARILLPLHYPDVGVFEVSVIARTQQPSDPPDGGQAAPDTPLRLSLQVNGTTLGTQLVEGQAIRRLRFEVPEGVTHARVNELWFFIEGGSIGFQTLRILDRTPPPSVAQRRHNQALRAARASATRDGGASRAHAPVAKPPKPANDITPRQAPRDAGPPDAAQGASSN